MRKSLLVILLGLLIVWAFVLSNQTPKEKRPRDVLAELFNEEPPIENFQVDEKDFQVNAYVDYFFDLFKTNLVRCIEANEEKILNLEIEPSDALLNANFVVTYELLSQLENLGNILGQSTGLDLKEVGDYMKGKTLKDFSDGVFEYKEFVKLKEYFNAEKNTLPLSEVRQGAELINTFQLLYQETYKENMQLVRKQATDICNAQGVY